MEDEFGEEEQTTVQDEKKGPKVVKKRIRKIIHQKPVTNNKKDQQKREEDELLAKLMANTTELEVSGSISTVNSRANLKTLKKTQQKEKNKIPTLSSKISLDFSDFTSFNSLKEAEKENTEREKKEEIQPQKLKLTRYASTTKLIERKTIERPTLKMMSDYEIKAAPRAFMCFDAPTLWDKRTGKLRRNSV